MGAACLACHVEKQGAGKAGDGELDTAHGVHATHAHVCRHQPQAFGCNHNDT